MKYKCADGIDRDKHIKRYLAIKKEIEAINLALKTLTARREKLGQEIGDISFQYLGAMGHIAMSKAIEGK